MTNRKALSLQIVDGQLSILDQQLLPDQEIWVPVANPDHMIEIIYALKVRGAPLIGVAAALSLALWTVQESPTREEFQLKAEALKQARPTAVNLMNAVDRLLTVATSNFSGQNLLDEALGLFDEDVALCEKMAKTGAAMIEEGENILTHCNTGGLATVGVGTALGVITEAHRQGKNIHVYVDETRPLLQGGRLTTWELEKAGVPYTLICDNMAAALMAQGKVQRVFVGADRIATNGDFANKIGTYNLAVLCQHHNVPFYTVAPVTTVDWDCPSGEKIPVELRKDAEVRGVFGSFGDVRWAPAKSKTHNPAFDVTPASLLTGIILDHRFISQEELKLNGVK